MNVPKHTTNISDQILPEVIPSQECIPRGAAVEGFKHNTGPYIA